MCKFFSPVIYLLPLLIVASQAHLTAEMAMQKEIVWAKISIEHEYLTAESIMQKEMEWAKSSMEKHHKSRGHLPLRSKVSRDQLYPVLDVDYDEDENIDQYPSSADADLNSVTLVLEPDKASNNMLRRNNIPDEIQKQNRTRMESSDY